MARLSKQAGGLLDGPFARGILLKVTVVFMLLGLVLFMVDAYRQRPALNGSIAASAQTSSAGIQDGAAPAAPLPPPVGGSIPKILHRVFIAGRANFDTLHNNKDSLIKAEWDDFCQGMHKAAGWQYMFWDNTTIIQLLEEHYPWYLDQWLALPKRVYKGDAIRYFIMHRVGGVYLDMDVECLREGYDMLENVDLVLQGTSRDEGLTNAVLASAPGHVFWIEHVIPLLVERGGRADPIFATGPALLRDSWARASGINMSDGPEDVNPLLGTHKWNGTTVQVYPLGKWYTPCFYNQGECRRDFEFNLSQGIKPWDVVGYHRYSGSWNIAHDNPNPANQNDKPDI